MSIAAYEFGTLSTGEKVVKYRMTNGSGAYAEVTPYGAVLVSVVVPDKNGEMRDVALGYDTVKDYERNPCFFGATIGRNGNRIGGAAFTLNGKRFDLAKNEGGCNLHSGPNGFEKKPWEAEVQEEKNRVKFFRISPDGENGFPGEMKVSVTYEFTEESEVRITYDAVCDQDTVANLTNHSYFNLNGEGSGSILNHSLRLLADGYTPVKDSGAIPTGVVAPVAGTPMDFTKATAIGERIDSNFAQLVFGGGYDHNYVTNDYEPGKMRLIAEAKGDVSGIEMQVFSDLPCVQFYAGNFILDEPGKAGHVYAKRSGFALETQVEPNAVNEPSFHTAFLKAKERYTTVTTYRFAAN